MYQLKQSTAITAYFFAYDANGDGVTGVADGSWTKRILKQGGAFGAMTVTITELENGWYSLPLSTSHTDTVGFLALSFSATGAKRVNLLFDVRPRLVDDLAYPATSGRSLAVDANGRVDVGAVLGTAQTAGDIIGDTNDIQSRLPAALVSGRIDASVGAMATDVLSAAALAAGAVTEIQSGLALAADLATAQADLDNIQTRLPAALVSGRMDASVGAMASGVLNAAALNADTDVYSAKLWLIDDNTGSNDRYLVVWYKNGQPITSGITSPTIAVVKGSDGTNLIAASTAMTQVGSLGVYKYDEGTNRVVSGAIYFADVRATIDSTERKHLQPLGRDS